MMKAISNNKSTSKIIQLVHKKSPITKNDERICISTGREHHLLDPKEILFLQANGGYCLIHLQDKKQLLSAKPLKHYVQKLSTHTQFIRVHQSYLINLTHLRTYHNDGYVTLHDTDERIPVSRRMKSSLKSSIKT